MSGYVNRNVGGWTELRVHGVAGTPPDSVLSHPHVVRVTGDNRAGFYRRRFEASCCSEDTGEQRLEAYSWGGLTAGTGQRALWLLLTPFLLLNVAFWAQPDPGRPPRGFSHAVGRVGDAAQRLTALTVTLTAMLAAVTVSMDLVGWQCVTPVGDSCATSLPWLSFLSWQWLALPGRRLAVTAVVPLAVVGLLWWLARKTWAETEAVRVPPAQSQGVQRTPLENRRMWNGTGPVRRLRAVHITAAFAIVGVFLLTPFARNWIALRAIWARRDVAEPIALAAEILLAAALLLLAVSVALACLPQMSDRTEAGRVDEHARHVDGYALLPWIALLVDVAALVLLWLPGLGTADPTPGAPRSPLPWLVPAVQLVIASQLVLLIVVVIVLILLRLGHRARRSAPTADRPGTITVGTVVKAPPAWFGLATAVLMMLGSALAGAYAAGLVLAVAQTLGRPAPTAGGLDTFVIPSPYFWAAALSVPVAALATVLVGLALLVIWRKARRSMLDEVKRAYPAINIENALAAPRAAANAATARRARSISAVWARAAVSDMGRRIAGAFVVGTAALIIAAAFLYVRDRDWIYTDVQWMVNVGDILVGGFALLMLYIGRQAYRNPRFRRSVGVLWDLGTFWPRATHPLAPPCYAERAVPDLINRIDYIGRNDGRVLLSCHSQGTVIGAAVVMQLTYEQSSRVALLTYGSPLRRLYARFFPVYFGLDALQRAGAFLLGPPPDTITDEARRAWPWRNLYRPSDPIGGAILIDRLATEISDESWRANPQFGDNDDIDRSVVDPSFAKVDGDTCYPATFGHSAYPADRAYAAAVAKIQQLRLAYPSDTGDEVDRSHRKKAIPAQPRPDGQGAAHPGAS